jgi:hypothetical protein
MDNGQIARIETHVRFTGRMRLTLLLFVNKDREQGRSIPPKMLAER